MGPRVSTTSLAQPLCTGSASKQIDVMMASARCQVFLRVCQVEFSSSIHALGQTISKSLLAQESASEFGTGRTAPAMLRRLSPGCVRWNCFQYSYPTPDNSVSGGVGKK